MFRIIFLFIFLTTSIYAGDQQVKPIKRKAFHFTKVENIVLSKWSPIISTGLCVYTANYLKNNWDNLEGNPNDPWTDHHLYSGYIAHLIGVYLKNYQPEFYHNHFGIRVFSNLSWLLMLDDAYQHLILQPHDNYHGPNDSYSEIANSPIGAYYRWALRPERDSEIYKLTFFHLPLWKNLDFSIGHYQGIFLALNYSIIKSFGPASSYVAVETTCKAVTGWNQKTRVSLRKVVLGPVFKLVLFKNFETEFGLGRQFYLEQNNRQGQIVNKYVTWFGVGLR
jgi:hypothetical protein